MISIYLVTNNLTGDSYVGKTKKTIEKRLEEHNGKSRHIDTHFARAIRKYGAEYFSISLLETTTEVEWRACETAHIAKLKPAYNMTSGGEGAHNRVMTEEAKQKLRDFLTGKPRDESTKQKISASLAGRKTGPLSQEARDKISAKHKGRVHSEKTRKKMSDAKRPPVTEETKALLSQKQKEVWAKRKR